MANDQAAYNRAIADWVAGMIRNYKCSQIRMCSPFVEKDHGLLLKTKHDGVVVVKGVENVDFNGDEVSIVATLPPIAAAKFEDGRTPSFQNFVSQVGAYGNSSVAIIQKEE